MVALVSVKTSLVHKFPEIGVRDSKMLSRKRREQLYFSILDIAEDVKVGKISPAEINEAMKGGISINDLEAKHFARLFDEIEVPINQLYLDSPDVIEARFGLRINALSAKPTRVVGAKQQAKKDKGTKYTRIVAEHKADSRYPVVSAASIIAKIERDREMDRLAKELGLDLGSGYPSDSKAIDAVKNNIRDRELKDYIRAYWKTVNNIKQTKLPEYS